MTLMANGKKVIGYALGGTEFYSMKENTDGSISFNGQTYVLKTKTSDSFLCRWESVPTYGVAISLSQQLNSDSALTVKDLIDKGEKIRLTVSFFNREDGYYSSLVSGTVDLSKPDSNGHFNFQWANNNVSTNTYCYSFSGQFITYSDAIRAYSSSNYDSGHMVIIYPDES